MTRRALCLALVLAVVAAAHAIAAAPEGPRLALVEFGSKPNRLVLNSVDVSGGQALRLAGGGKRARPLPLLLDGPSWSGDGSLIAFTGIGGKVGGTSGFAVEGTQMYVVGADGTGLRPVPGTTEGQGPVLSPDGRTIAFTRIRERRRTTRRGVEEVVYRSWSVWTAGVDGDGSTRLTPWRNGLRMSVSSFSPDGSTLAVSRAKHEHAAPEIIAMRLDGGGSTVIARSATDAVYSPDGAKLAFMRVSRKGSPDLFTMNADGSEPHRLTRTPKGIELWPSWDPSGRQLVVTRVNGESEAGLFFGLGNAVIEMNADGSCPTTILEDRDTAFYGATWQPGPGREAGPIAC
jgi:Tol biopolymer transport system component